MSAIVSRRPDTLGDGGSGRGWAARSAIGRNLVWSSEFEVFNAIWERRSIHHFSGEGLADEVVMTLLEAAGRVPTAGNLHETY
jgi:hypothetical protein